VQGVDVARVSEWLASNVRGAVAPFDFALIAGGRSNLTFAVRGADDQRFVLRRPPLGHVLATAHDMAREHRILTGVGRTGVPVPRVLGLCTDESVNGAPFYVMTYVDGVVLDSVDRAATLEPQTRHRLAEDLFDVLADLHAVDVDAVGLGELSRRDGYVERQIKRWSTQWEQSKTRELADIDEVARRLRDRVPAQRGTSIVHGDYRFGNCLVDPHAGRIAAVLDWELCTLGDPLADVGYLGVYWFSGDTETARSNDPTPAGGFPPYDQMVQRYATRSGRDVTDVDYYTAFSCFRLAVISEGVYARYLHGAMGDPGDADVNAFRDATPSLAARALALLTTTG
jgi:aminoglycoside phosphotransferase (APT) family kinase protein